MSMQNPKMFQVKFEMSYGEINYTLNALVKPTDNPKKFHVLRVHSLNTRENASVVDDFYIAKIIRDNVPVWVHTDSETSSHIVQAIGNALEQHYTIVLS